MMKKLSVSALMALAAAMALPTPCQAYETLMDWSVYKEASSAYNSSAVPNLNPIPTMFDEVESKNMTTYAALHFNKEAAKRYAGCKVLGVKAVSGFYYDLSAQSPIKVSIAYGLDETPIYTTEYTAVGSEMDMSTYDITWAKDVVEFPSDFEMMVEEDKDFYVIFEYYEGDCLWNYEFVTDLYTYNGSSPAGAFYSAIDGEFATNGEWKTYTKEWMDASDCVMPIAGMLCASVTLSGDNLPQNSVEVISVSAPNHVTPGEAFDVTANLRNAAGNPITEVTAVLEYGNQTKEQTFTIEEMLYDHESSITFAGISYDEDAILPISVTITKVNGIDNNAVNAKGITSCACLSDGYKRNVVAEEGTGTWCGWCIRGIVAMETMNELFPDGSFVGMAVHKGDEMDPANSEEIYNCFSEMTTGFPCVVIDREAGYSMIFEKLLNVYKDARAIPVQAEVNATYSIGEDGIVVSSETNFAVNDEKTNYMVQYVVMENKVGPYMQKNYYSGGGNGEMGGYEDKDEEVLMKYNEVVRNYCPEEYCNILKGVEKGGSYKHNSVLPLTNVSKTENAYVIALLINKDSGVIVNACKATDITTGISLSKTADVKVKAIDGAIWVAGCDFARIYSLDGKAVATAADGSLTRVAPGAYLVKAGNSTFKVIVK